MEEAELILREEVTPERVQEGVSEVNFIRLGEGLLRQILLLSQTDNEEDSSSLEWTKSSNLLKAEIEQWNSQPSFPK